MNPLKLGLIADVHANAEHLRRALAVLRARGADVILCAGDLADGDSEGQAAADLIREQAIPCVQGNHDLAATRANADAWRERWDEASFGPPPWQYGEDALSDENRAFLRDLPPTRRFEFAGKRVLLTHAAPWDQTTYIFPNGRPAPFERIATEAEADVVILGHTHLPMAVEVNGVWVFNPGSVDGSRAEPYTATCALLELPIVRYQVFDLETGQPSAYTFTKLGDLGRNMHTAAIK